MYYSKLCYFNLLLLSLILSACSKDKESDSDKDDSIADVVGLVEKGPFLKGAEVSVFELDEKLEQTGRVVKTSLISDAGEYKLSENQFVSNFVFISVEGYYFNEVTGKISDQKITLTSVANISDSRRLNVNILTHLAANRIKALAKELPSYEQAKQQASKEVLRAFFVKEPNLFDFGAVSLNDGSAGADILLTVSGAILQFTDSDVRLAEFIQRLSDNLFSGYGELHPEISDGLKLSLATLDTATLATNMNARFDELKLEKRSFSFQQYFDVPIEAGTHIIAPETPNNQFENEEQVHLLLRNQFHRYAEAAYLLDRVYTHSIDRSLLGANRGLLDLFDKNHNASNTLVDDVFRQHYAFLHICNTIIKNNTFLREEATVLRAYLMLNAMTYWGDIFYTETTDVVPNSSMYRWTKEEICSLLIDQLEKIKSEIAVDNPYLPLCYYVVGKLRLMQDDPELAKDDFLTLKDIIPTTAHEEQSFFPFVEDLFHSKDGLIRNYGPVYSEVNLLLAEVFYKLGDRLEAEAALSAFYQKNAEKGTSFSSDLLDALANAYHRDDNIINSGVYFGMLKRNGLTEKKLGIKSFQNVLPIPFREFLLNPNAQQNPGY